MGVVTGRETVFRRLYRVLTRVDGTIVEQVSDCTAKGVHEASLGVDLLERVDVSPT